MRMLICVCEYMFFSICVCVYMCLCVYLCMCTYPENLLNLISICFRSRYNKLNWYIPQSFNLQIFLSGNLFLLYFCLYIHTLIVEAKKQQGRWVVVLIQLMIFLVLSNIQQQIIPGFCHFVLSLFSLVLPLNKLGNNRPILSPGVNIIKHRKIVKRPFCCKMVPLMAVK